MEELIKNFINSINTNTYDRIRTSKSNAECRRYLKEHLQKQLILGGVSKSFYCYDETVQIAEETGDKIIKCEQQCENCNQ